MISRIDRSESEILHDLQTLNEDRRRRVRLVLQEMRTWVRDTLRDQHKTQMDLAVVGAMSPTTVCNLAKGKNVRICTLAQAADALGYRLRLVFEPLS